MKRKNFYSLVLFIQYLANCLANEKVNWIEKQLVKHWSNQVDWVIFHKIITVNWQNYSLFLLVTVYAAHVPYTILGIHKGSLSIKIADSLIYPEIQVIQTSFQLCTFIPPSFKNGQKKISNKLNLWIWHDLNYDFANTVEEKEERQVQVMEEWSKRSLTVV